MARESMLWQLLKAGYEQGKQAALKNAMQNAPEVASKAKEFGHYAAEKGWGAVRELGIEPAVHHAASAALGGGHGGGHGDGEEHGGTKALIAEILAKLSGAANIAGDATIEGLRHMGTPALGMLKAGAIPTATHLGRAALTGLPGALRSSIMLQGLTWDAQHPKAAGESSDLIRQAMQADQDEAYARYIANMASRNVLPRYTPTFQELAQRRNGMY